MAVNYTPLTNGQLANATNFNGPLQQLDNAIEALVAGTKSMTSPAIASFALAGHSHQDAAGGNKLLVGAINSAATPSGRTIVADGAGGAAWGHPGIIPAGIMYPFGGAVLPNGFLWCNGAAVSRATYTLLFAAIGVNFGVGDGITTFNVPDLRGRAPTGIEAMGGAANAGRLASVAGGGVNIGTAGGEDVHTLTLPEIPAHNHGGGSVIRSGGATANFAAGANQSGALSTDGGSLSHNNMQPFLLMPWIIFAGV